MKQLPIQFVNNMKSMLKQNFNNFLNSYNNTSNKAICLNQLKVSNYKEIAMLKNLKPVPWNSSGLYYLNTENLGKSVLHTMGLYYIQQPCAMSVVNYMGIEQNQKVLDLCASPGGKSANISNFLLNTGLLVSNEIIKNRAEILAENIVRLGISNTIVTNESPQKLSNIFENYFDRILVDAPCSGEGMFRKDENSILEWNIAHTKTCKVRQLEILNSACTMLKPNGIIAYSTCTFNTTENEEVISEFLNSHKNFHCIKINNLYESFVSGFSENKNIETKNMVRLFPHLINGEGHTFAILKKDDTEYFNKTNLLKSNVNLSEIKIINNFISSYKINLPKGVLYKFANNIYLCPENCFDFKGVVIKLAGLYLGEIKNNLFFPSYNLAKYLLPTNFSNNIELTEQETQDYFKGLCINKTCQKGWVLLTYLGYSLGFGKSDGTIIKNHFPKNLRQ